MWRRYEGFRDKKYEKIWTPTNLDELELRLDDYFDSPDKLDWNEGKVIK